MSLSVDVASDLCDQVAAWEAAFLSEVSLDRFRRASTWAMSETAKAAKEGATGRPVRRFPEPHAVGAPGLHLLQGRRTEMRSWFPRTRNRCRPRRRPKTERAWSSLQR